LLRREAELIRWALPAVRLYTGWQHRYMMIGVNAIRHKFGSAACALKIISAGYGLVDEDRNPLAQKRKDDSLLPSIPKSAELHVQRN
jgi:hypothetical protein